MYLHHEAKLMYLASPRTASKSTAAALQSVGFKQVDDIKGSPSALHHLTVEESGRSTDGWTVFCAVRNHWDTVVSWHLNLVGGLGYTDPHDLDWSLRRMKEALDNNPWVGERTLWHRHTPHAVCYIRFEQMQPDLFSLLARYGLTMLTLPHIKEHTVSLRGGRHYSEFFTVETRDYVRERFADEIVEHGYYFEGAP